MAPDFFEGGRGLKGKGMGEGDERIIELKTNVTLVSTEKEQFCRASSHCTTVHGLAC